VLIVGLGLVAVGRLGWRELNLARGSALFAALAVPWQRARRVACTRGFRDHTSVPL